MPFVNDFSIGKTASDTPFSRRGQTTASWGTNETLVGDKRDPRRGQTGTPFAASVECVEYQLFAKPLKKEAAQGIKNRFV